MTIVSRLYDAGFPVGADPDEACPRCLHVWGNHMVFASNSGDPVDGGHCECPYVGCECRIAWDLTDEQRAQAKLAREQRR